MAGGGKAKGPGAVAASRTAPREQTVAFPDDPAFPLLGTLMRSDSSDLGICTALFMRSREAVEVTHVLPGRDLHQQCGDTHS